MAFRRAQLENHKKAVRELQSRGFKKDYPSVFRYATGMLGLDSILSSGSASFNTEDKLKMVTLSE